MSDQIPHLPQAADDDPAIERLSALLAAPATEHELSGLDAALVGFRAAQVDALSPTPQRRPSMLSSLTRAKLAATIAAATIGVGGVAAVAVSARHQPAATPNAHSSVAATPTMPAGAAAAGDQAATPTGAPTGTPVGPDATGSAAHGLCTAWAAHEAGSGEALGAIAFKNLATAAGGADKVATFCATVTAPGKSGDHPTGKPATLPTPTDAGKPADPGKPATLPTPTDPGKPATVPTPTATHPTGRP
ncbi:hypothetical protein ACWEOW_21755 [Monashia sp. NPDC004114]